MGTIANGLNGKIKVLKGVGRGATWVLPAVLGMINVANASPERRIRVLLEEGFGIIGGVGGTSLSVATGLYILPFLAFGPFGSFIILFILGGIGGYYASKAGRFLGGQIYDSEEEIFRAKRFAIVGLIFIGHIFVFVILSSIYPEQFS